MSDLILNLRKSEIMKDHKSAEYAIYCDTIQRTTYSKRYEILGATYMAVLVDTKWLPCDDCVVKIEFTRVRPEEK